MKKTLAIAAAALMLTACGGSSEEPAEPSTTTVTETAPAPEPSTTTVTETAKPEPVEGPEPVETEAFGGNDDIADAAMEATWSEMTPQEQDDICWGWEFDKDLMYGFFVDGAGDAFNEEDVYAFFDAKCGA